MESSMTLYELLSLVVSILTLVALGLAVWQIRINRQQLYLSTITKCVQDFRSLSSINQSTTDRELIWRYVDLVSEELFYFQHDYVPRNVSLEWIDGMIDYLPITDKEGRIQNEDKCLKLLASESEAFLINFPRIRFALTVKQSYDWKKIYSSEMTMVQSRVIERMKLSREVLSNVKNGSIYY